MNARTVIAIFAHNEAHQLPAMLDSLAVQDLFDHTDSLLMILSNGSTDKTVEVAKGHPLADRMGERYLVRDYLEGGKSLTWNRFVTDPLAKDADVLLFLDADIFLGGSDVLSSMADALRTRPELLVTVSRPVPQPQSKPTLIGRLIRAGSGTSHDWRKSICGQLYGMKGSAARRLRLPQGLPVEDGFLRAMVLTDALEEKEDLTRIDGLDNAWHWYVPETTLGGLMRHQVRLVIGTSLNASLFAKLGTVAKGRRHRFLQDAADDPEFVSRTVAEALPRWPYGYVQPQILYNRSLAVLRNASNPGGFKKLLLLPVFLVYDSLIYVRSQWAMARGVGAGHW